MTIRAGSLVGLAIGVSVVAALVGAFFGGVAGQMYVSESVRNQTQLASAGMWWGGGSGFVVGLLWCAAMVPIALRFGPKKLGRIGALCGLVVGSLATLALHTALARVAGVGGVVMGLECLFFAVPVGLAAGAACGCVCRVEVRRTLPETERMRWAKILAEKEYES